MIDQLLEFNPPPSILVPELEQVLKDIDFLDTKIDEYWVAQQTEFFEKAQLRKGVLMAYRDKLMVHLKDRLGVK